MQLGIRTQRLSVFIALHTCWKSRYRDGYGLDDRGPGIRFPVGLRIFTSPYRLDRLWGPIQCVPGVKRPGREADLSPPTNAEVKKTWTYTPTPQYNFIV
jgi:hypothetical protein